MNNGGMAGPDEDEGAPRTPLLDGGHRGQGGDDLNLDGRGRRATNDVSDDFADPRGRRPVNQGKVVAALTVLFAAVLIIAIVVLAIRAEHAEAEEKRLREEALELCPKKLHDAILDNKLQLTPEQRRVFAELASAIDSENGTKAMDALIEEHKRDQVLSALADPDELDDVLKHVDEDKKAEYRATLIKALKVEGYDVEDDDKIKTAAVKSDNSDNGSANSDNTNKASSGNTNNGNSDYSNSGNSDYANNANSDNANNANSDNANNANSGNTNNGNSDNNANVANTNNANKGSPDNADEEKIQAKTLNLNTDALTNFFNKEKEKEKKKDKDKEKKEKEEDKKTAKARDPKTNVDLTFKHPQTSEKKKFQLTYKSIIDLKVNIEKLGRGFTDDDEDKKDNNAPESKGVLDSLNDNGAKLGDDDDKELSTVNEKEAKKVSSGAKSASSIHPLCTEERPNSCKSGSGICYADTDRCNRKVDCGNDASDEAGCSCAEYENRRECDEYCDCPDCADEPPKCWNSTCGVNFSCGKPKDGQDEECINNGLICDNRHDCANYNDEDVSRCVALSPADSPLKPDTFWSPYTEGILHWRIPKAGVFPVTFSFMDGDQKLKPFLDELVEQVCDEIIGEMTDEDFKPKWKREKFKLNKHPMIKKVHNVFVAKADEDDQTPFRYYGGKFQFSEAHDPTDDTELIHVDCGKPKAGSSSGDVADVAEKDRKAQVRIVGGKPSGQFNWPFICALFKDGVQSCGATIINANHAITAAHCVDKFAEEKFYFELLCGVLRVDSKAPYGRTYPVAEIFMHPEYEPNTMANDIAVLRTNISFIYGKRVVPAAMPDDFMPTLETNETSICYTAGWGVTNTTTNRPSKKLLHVEMPIFAPCPNRDNFPTDDEKQICGGKREGGVDSCSGDSGGPLLCRKSNKRKDRRTWVLSGVVSWGLGCGKAEKPGVYTRVSAYLDFIHKFADVDTRSLVDFHPHSNLKPRQECDTYVCDGRCLSRYQLCNFFADCLNAHDELYCIRGHFTKPHPVTTPAPYRPPHRPNQPHKHDMISHPYSPKPHHGCDPSKYFECSLVKQCLEKQRRCDFTVDCIDGSDERDCKCVDYIRANRPEYICDGYPDCRDWADEENCDRCSHNKAFYCDISRKCVDKTKVCDGKHDCAYGEDERNCLTLLNSDAVWIQRDGRPRKSDSGLVAYNYKGHWVAACVNSWSQQLADNICNYMNFPGAQTYNLFVPRGTPYQNLHGKIVRTMDLEGEPVFNRPDDGKKRRRKRASGTGVACYFIKATCSSNARCGKMPRFADRAPPKDRAVAGAFPWHITLYKNGEQHCGCTLVHAFWIMCHVRCTPDDPFDTRNNVYVAQAGGHRAEFSLSAHDQLRRVRYFVTAPNTNVSLGFLAEGFELNDYVNPVCIPDVTWIPVNNECFFTGDHDGNLKHPVSTTVRGVCEYVDDNQYKFCTAQRNPSNECMHRWSGALVCPDSTGTYYAVGVYYAHHANCGIFNNLEPTPYQFDTLVSPYVRETIRSLIQTRGNQTGSDFGTPNCDSGVRCPKGKCLLAEQVCDNSPICSDFSDEDPNVCSNPTPNMCEPDPIDPDKCMCRKNEFLCKTGVCLDKEKYYCNGEDNCGDGSDEDPECNTCLGYYQSQIPDRVCDGRIDCHGKFILGADEGADACCDNSTLGLDPTLNEYSYRCVSGLRDSTVNVQDVNLNPIQCISSRHVCDWNQQDFAVNGQLPDCLNGADEADCVTLWPRHKNVVTGSRDAFGRFINHDSGYLYFVAFGRKYLYCASRKIWNDRTKDIYARAICRHEGYADVRQVALTAPNSKTRVGEGIPSTLSESERQRHYDNCAIVFISCKKRHQY